MNKQEAASFLNVSVRAVERYAASDKLSSRYVRGKTGQVLDFDPDDLERFKAALETPVAKGTTSEPETTSEATSKGRVGQQAGPRQASTKQLARLDETESQAGNALALLARMVREASPDNHRQILPVPVEALVLLKLEEAAALTGLSRVLLRQAISDNTLKARRIGRSWRIKRADLDQYISQL